MSFFTLEILLPCSYTFFTFSALKGRFLHITDIHPDPHYKAGSTFESGCHRKRTKDGKNKGKVTENERSNEDLDDKKLDTLIKNEDLAGKWGTAVS